MFKSAAVVPDPTSRTLSVPVPPAVSSIQIPSPVSLTRAVTPIVEGVDRVDHAAERGDFSARLVELDYPLASPSESRMTNDADCTPSPPRSEERSVPWPTVCRWSEPLSIDDDRGA